MDAEKLHEGVKLMKKTIIVLLGLLLTAGILFAGGQKDQGKAKAPAAAKSAPAVVKIWGWRTQDADVWKKAQEALQAKGENIVIKYETFVPTEYDSKVLLSLQGGSAADIFYTRRLPGARTQGLIDNGYLVPLNGKVDLKAIPETTLNSIRSKGKVWGVPFANQVVGIFYNKDIFDKYGFSEPDTWAQLVAISKKLKADGITPFMIPGKAGWALAMQHAMVGVSSPGSDWIGKLAKGEAKFTDPEFVNIGKRLNDLKVYYQKDFIANSTDEMSAGFALGQGAMVFYGIWGGTNWKKLNPDFHYGFFPVPVVKKGDKPAVYVYMDGAYGLNPASKSMDAALKVLSYAATPAYGTTFSNVTGEMTAVSGATLPKDKLILQECYKTANEMAAANTYWVGSVFQNGTPNVYSILREKMQSMYLGDITPEQLAQDVQDGLATWYKPLQK